MYVTKIENVIEAISKKKVFQLKAGEECSILKQKTAPR